MNTIRKHANQAALVLMACLMLSACGQKEAAASMHLIKSEGMVGVADGKGNEVELIERLGLYNGYQVGTQRESYAWIDLDEEKVAKLDESSEIEVEKEGKALTAHVKSGNLFFHVAEPLADEESFEIRSSTMMVGIRGTCGWVETADNEHMSVYILEGTVEGSIAIPEQDEEERESVSAGERAVLSIQDGMAEIHVEKFGVSDIPAFVLEELLADEALCQKILEASGLDVRGGDPGDEEPDRETQDGTDETEEGLAETRIMDIGGDILASGGGVILIVKDDLCGAVNEQGEEIVPARYPYYYCEPSYDGIFALGDEEQCTFFDREGRELLTVPLEGTEGISAKIGEGKITYVQNNVVCCYDIESDSIVTQIELGEDAWCGGVSPVQDGSFYYSTIDDGLFLVRTDGSVRRIDDAREDMWKAAGWQPHSDIYVEPDPEISGSQITGAGVGDAMPRYIQSTVKEGYMPVMSWEMGAGIALFDCQAQQYYEIDMTTDEARQTFLGQHEWHDEVSWSIQEYYSDAQWYGNRGMQMVLCLQYQDGNSKSFLLDFSGAELNEYREVTNLSDIILAEYEYIELTEKGWYLAAEEGEYFYLDEQGSRIDMPDMVDCSAYYNGYAMIVEGDGMAYVVDMDFRKVTQGYPADGAVLYGDLFVIFQGEENKALFIN